MDREEPRIVFIKIWEGVHWGVPKPVPDCIRFQAGIMQSHILKFKILIVWAVTIYKQIRFHGMLILMLYLFAMLQIELYRCIRETHWLNGILCSSIRQLHQIGRASCRER